MLHYVLKQFAGSPSRRLVSVLALSSAAGLAMLTFRLAYAGTHGYRSLPWDLFLAWLPVLFALGVSRMQEKPRMPWVKMLLLAFVWLLFFPNAPYLLTQFMHLHPNHAISDLPHRFAGWTPRGNIPVWYDVMMLSTYAWTGLLLGFVSLHLIHRSATRLAGAACGWAVAVAGVGLCAFGVSLGRFQRWNSWDLFAQPLALLSDVVDRVVNPFTHLRTSAVTIVFAAFLLLGYLSLIALMQLRTSETVGNR